MAFVLVLGIAVITGAGVFQVVAVWAVTHVEAEFGADFLPVRCYFEGDDGWDVVAIGEFSLGEQ